MAETRGARLEALDLLRGLAVAGMILVTSPGDWNKAYWPLRHAEWNGWTPTDMVFPTFLFGVGMALALSFPRALGAPEERRRFWGRVGRRMAALIALGLILNGLAEAGRAVWMPEDSGLGHVRIPGILQRIALCYGLGAVLIVATGHRDGEGRTQIDARAIGIAAAAILLLYWALLTFVPVPGYGAGRLDQAGSLPAYIDRAVFTVPHLWRLGFEHWGGPVFYDPEGLLSTLPATANLLFGVLAARALRANRGRAAFTLAGAGIVLIAAGLLLDPIFVINKRLWTSSFALLSSGFSMLVLAALATALRSQAMGRAMTPLRILGGNAILAFVLSQLLGLFGGLPVPGHVDPPMNWQQWGNGIALRGIADPWLASLACALAIVALVTLAIWPLHRRGIHLRL